MKEAIVITGTGAICAAGNSPREIHQRLCEGHTALGPLREWNSESWPVPIAGVVEKLDAGALFEDRKLLKAVQRLRRTDLLGLYAAGQAVHGSAMLGHRAALDDCARAEFNERTAMYTGCGGVGYYYQYDFMPALAAAAGELRRFGEKFAASVNPTWLLQSLPNNALCYLGIAFGFKGPNTCITNHGVSGSQAIIESFHSLRDGQADRAIAVGHHAPLEPEMILNLYHLGLLTVDSMRPFDANRSGSILGEGAGAMVLETQASALARGASILGEILGTGLTTEAGGPLSSRIDGDGQALAIEMALQEAGIEPREVTMIVAHGSGAIESDLAEAAAIRRVFGARIPVITSFKWAFGHTIAAAGAIDAVIALGCLHAAMVPAIATLRDPDPAFRNLNLAASATALHGGTTLVLDRGFGGMNSALLIKFCASDPHEHS